MKTMKKYVKWMMLIILSGIALNGVFAQYGQGRTRDQGERVPFPRNGRMYTMQGADSMRMMQEPGRMLDIPGLTAEQREKIKKSDLELLKVVTPLRNMTREHKAHLETLLATQPVDLKAADQVADEIAKNRAAMLKLAIRHDQEIRGFLTPDQQVVFDSRPKPFLGEGKEAR